MSSLRFQKLNGLSSRSFIKLFLLLLLAGPVVAQQADLSRKTCVTYPECQETYDLHWNSGDTPLTQAQINLYMSQAADEWQWHVALVSFDQFVNATFFWGHPDETISAHVRRDTDNPNNHNYVARVINLFLNVVQKDHGARAQAGDLERAIKIVQVERHALGLPPIDLLK